MQLLILIFGILIVSVAFERSKRLGSLLLAIVVMALLLTAKKKEIIQ